jgi:hypothetical protein
MNYLQEYEVEKAEWVEKQLAEYERKTGLQLDARQRDTLRGMKRREFDFYEREAVRVDNNNSHDDQ